MLAFRKLAAITVLISMPLMVLAETCVSRPYIELLGADIIEDFESDSNSGDSAVSYGAKEDLLKLTFANQNYSITSITSALDQRIGTIILGYYYYDPSVLTGKGHSYDFGGTFIAINSDSGLRIDCLDPGALSKSIIYDATKYVIEVYNGSAAKN